MKINYITFVLACLVSNVSVAQSPSSFPIKKFYLAPVNEAETAIVSASSLSQEARVQINGESLDACTPCIMEVYNAKNQLVEIGKRYYNCRVGDFKEYHENGKIKVRGQFVDPEKGNYKELSDSFQLKCRVSDGTWTYYNESGKEIYQESWDKGYFQKQVPEQSANEIWKVQLTVKQETVPNRPITMDELTDLEVTTLFKNKSVNPGKFNLQLTYWEKGKSAVVKSFEIKDSNPIRISDLLKTTAINTDALGGVQISILQAGESIKVNYYGFE